jgi:hypothetical protein
MVRVEHVTSLCGMWLKPTVLILITKISSTVKKLLCYSYCYFPLEPITYKKKSYSYRYYYHYHHVMIVSAAAALVTKKEELLGRKGKRLTYQKKGKRL